jgi:hypothetical protein
MSGFSHVNSYNNQKRASLTSISKQRVVNNVKIHNEKGRILAHLVNFKMYRTTTYKSIAGQNAELALLKNILSPEEFKHAQELVRNRSILCQRQLPSHFTQAIIDLIDKRDEHYNFFLANLGPNAEQFLEENGVILAPSNPLKALPAEILSKTLEFLNKDDQLSFAATDKYNRAFIASEKGYRELERPINLKFVKLNDKIVNDDDKFEAFLTYLKSPRCAIEKLDLGGLFFSKDKADKLIEALSINKTVTDLNLSKTILDNGINQTVSHWGKVGSDYYKLEKLTNLKSLNISGNFFELAHLNYLLSKLKKLESLDISGCGIVLCDGIYSNGYLLNVKNHSNYSSAVRKILRLKIKNLYINNEPANEQNAATNTTSSVADASKLVESSAEKTAGAKQKLTKVLIKIRLLQRTCQMFDYPWMRPGKYAHIKSLAEAQSKQRRLISIMKELSSKMATEDVAKIAEQADAKASALIEATAGEKGGFSHFI